MKRWECINGYGAVVYDGLFPNEARLIAEQHGLLARPRLSAAERLAQFQADQWYADEVARMSERAPA